jgi:hypothetical protein
MSRQLASLIGQWNWLHKIGVSLLSQFLTSHFFPESLLTRNGFAAFAGKRMHLSFVFPTAMSIAKAPGGATSNKTSPAL